jgi:ABC-type lipoprotein export system ATPase subunit
MSNIRADELGSDWRLWDLHLHTPTSHDYGDKSVTNQDIVDALKRAEIKVAAITDHHTINTERVRDLQRIAGNELTILPGIELTTQLGGSESVHIIGLFSETSNIEDIWQKLSVLLKLTEADLTSKRPEQISVTFEASAEAIHDLGGIVSAHAGSKTNTFENIKNTAAFKLAFKADYLRKYIDLVEVGKQADKADYTEKVFKEVKVERPLVICSDNHNIRNLAFKAKLWIKGDATFLGLKQTMIEPKDRVFIGEEPPPVRRVRENPTRYITAVEIRRNTGSALNETWFDQKLSLNPGLIAIIGNKGSGKSALADIIGYLGDCSTYDYCSFLNDRKFRDRKQPQPKASHFWGQLFWASGGDSGQKSLNAPPFKSSFESVKYIPQMYLENICTDYESGQKTEFATELKNVIFSHVPEADRLETNNLDALLLLKTKETERGLDLKRAELQSLNARISALEEQRGAEYKKRLEEKRDERDRTLKAEEKLKPVEVLPPATNPDNEATYKALRLQIAELDTKIKELDVQIEGTRKILNSATKSLAAISRVRQRLSIFKTEIDGLLIEIKAELEGIDIDVASLFQFKFDNTQLDRKVNELNKQLTDCKNALDKSDNNSLIGQRALKVAELENLKTKLDEPQLAYEKYLVDLAAHLQRKKDIIGDATKNGTLEYFKGKIADLVKIPGQIAALQAERKALVLVMYMTISLLAEEYKSAYKGVQEFIDSHSLATEKGLQFSVAVTGKGLSVGFMDYIDASRKGNLRGKEGALDALNKLAAQADLQTGEGVTLLMDELLKLLWVFESKEQDYSFVSNQIRLDKSLSSLYDFVFGLEYLEIDYTLAWNGKPIDQLSPGERGTLLLIFYLLVDKNDIPLVMDQPEENLDNQTVFDTLVDSIREAKQRRQVIIVTHNPNLAVVCDADQIIYSKLEKDKGNRVVYTTGALENPVITKLVIDVLEGTRKAFDVRDAKYRLAERWKLLLGHKA